MNKSNDYYCFHCYNLMYVQLFIHHRAHRNTERNNEELEKVVGHKKDLKKKKKLVEQKQKLNV